MTDAACRHERGSGSAVIGVLQFAVASLASAAAGVLHNDTIYPMVSIILACSLLSGLVYLIDQLAPKRRPTTNECLLPETAPASGPESKK
ncbi:MAG: hypothetical protein PHI97_20715 [Desulfobulbus sp.]|nr:hypothetical protein [Desulfobulbus sp.]